MPYYKKYLLNYLINWIPKSVPANALTMIANIGTLVAFVCMMAIPNPQSGVLVLMGLCIFFYVTLDNLDGAQARRNNTCNALGEFLDHWVDCYNNLMIAVSMGIALKIQPVLLLFAVAASMLGYMATLWEQYRTGWINLGRVGSVEGLFLVLLMYFVAAIGGAKFVGTPVVLGLSAVDLLAVTAIVVYMLTFAAAAIRLRYHNSLELVPALVIQFWFIIWYLTGNVNYVLLISGMMVCGALLCGRVLIARCTCRRFQPMEWGIGIIMLLVVFGQAIFKWSLVVQNTIGVLLLILFIILSVVDFVRTTHNLTQALGVTFMGTAPDRLDD